MPQRAWNSKRERQYEHIKNQAEERGTSSGRAEEIAARTVNKNRAQRGESKRRSKTATQDIPPQRRGGIRSGNRTGPGGRTKDQLYADAQRARIPGRSTMTKSQLEQALRRTK
ncbi:plasmid stabilization protein [Saccharopolyspora cebuensis]|uniref:Plasmid stabilization protein n=1 Tax=Saccharopolyspora cebuensis TaxID=418759 RepID=A0ABV4CPP0_9PSEU